MEPLTEIYFKVNPGQENFNIKEEEMVKVDLTEEASKGRANTELIAKLKKITGEEPGLVSGHSSSRKKLVFDQEESEIRRKIDEYNRK